MVTSLGKISERIAATGRGSSIGESLTDKLVSEQGLIGTLSLASANVAEQPLKTRDKKFSFGQCSDKWTNDSSVSFGGFWDFLLVGASIRDCMLGHTTAILLIASSSRLRPTPGESQRRVRFLKTNKGERWSSVSPSC